MAQGLQAWDASGNLILDIGDYSTRYIESMRVTLSSGQASRFVATVNSVDNSTHFAAVVNSSEASILQTEFTTVVGENGFWVVALTGSVSYSRWVDVDVYAYI